MWSMVLNLTPAYKLWIGFNKTLRNVIVNYINITSDAFIIKFKDQGHFCIYHATGYEGL